MIDSNVLLKDLRRLLKALEDDLRTRVSENPALDNSLKIEWQSARDAGRTAVTYTEWLDEEITQAGVHWILGCVFIRFLEDNDYLSRPILSGPSEERRALARDRHEQYFRSHPTESDRDYLLAAFREVATLPGMAGLFDERHNPVFRVGVSGDGAMQLLAFWQKVNPDSGKLIHDFSDSSHETRFLGDLYQDLSESARKRYALLQTPVFVEEFILDRTLTPALNEFGYREVRLVDPTCGSGHFLLGAFQRMFDAWARNEPARNVGDIAQRALDAVYGVDLNAFAVAIARFRLLIAALNACRVERLRDAPAFRINVAAGDSLLHGRRFSQLDLGGEAENLIRSGLAHAYEIEDLDEVNRILGQQYHVVTGNPPYVTPKDQALNEAYRSRYATCHMKYSLAVPFTERFFDLAMQGDGTRTAGFIGMITANSFMKREFGKKLVESFLSRVDLTHVIDTGGAYIPGHGTPTVILFARSRSPLGSTVRTVMGIKGEPSTPPDPAKGQVWRAILDQVDQVGSESAFISVTDSPRTAFAKHPWSMGGGGATDLSQLLSDASLRTLQGVVEVIGVQAFTLEDEAFVVPRGYARRAGVPSSQIAPFLTGIGIRDWIGLSQDDVIFPYDQNLNPFLASGTARHLWRYRRVLEMRMMFRKTQIERGLPWFVFGMFIRDRYLPKEVIAHSFVATHNQFALVSGAQVMNRHAPVFVVKPNLTDEEKSGLDAVLNSSVGCFWMKLNFHNKGSTVDEHGARQRTDPFEDFYEFSGTGLLRFPLPKLLPSDIGKLLHARGIAFAENMPSEIVLDDATAASIRVRRDRAMKIRRAMIALQEELDWRCYRLYGLVSSDLECVNPPEIDLGERAFEISLARRGGGASNSSWFERHRSRPTTEIPGHWPEGYRRVVEERIRLIEADRYIGLIERPEHKRRWNIEPWEEQEKRALRLWLLDRLEDDRYWGGVPRLKSFAKLADATRADPEFVRVAELYTERSDFDPSTVVRELIESEAIPFVAVLRYSDSGLRKRREWETCWAAQRQEDAIDAEIAAALERGPEEPEDAFAARRAAEQKRRKAEEVGNIPVPPKYKAADFPNAAFWRLRGPLDVPKERFISYPYCTRDADGTTPIAWAGWDHLRQAKALAAYLIDVKENEGWSPERLKPLLTGLQELVPWLKQWHNEYDTEHATRIGDYFESFVIDEARALGFSVKDVEAWSPGSQVSGKGRRKRRAASIAEEL